MLLVQEYLKTHTLSQLASEHGVYARFSKCRRKFSLNYDMIESKDSDPIAQECRGLVLGLTDNKIASDNKLEQDSLTPGETFIIAFPFKRFFNYGQGSAAEIQWNDPNLSIFEKADGTATFLYFCPFSNQWHIATRSVSEADLPVDGNTYTFRTLFEKALVETTNLSFEEFTSNLNKDITYIFELCTPHNQIVVRHEKSHIVFLAARNVKSLDEYDINKIDVCGVPHIKQYNLNNIQDILNFVNSREPSKFEGVVVRDSLFNRVKIKNPGYLAISRLKDSCGSIRSQLELILSEKDDDAIQLLPKEIANEIFILKEKVQHCIKIHDSAYKEIISVLHEPSKKDFALALLKHKELWSAPLFQIFDNKCESIRDFINKNRNDDGTWSNSFLDKILDCVDIK